MADPTDLSWWFGTAGGAPPSGTYQDREKIMNVVTQGLGTNHVAPTVDVGGPFRQAQLGQIGQLQQVAGGQAMGAGQMAAQRGMNSALAAQQAQARMARGPGAGFAALGAARNAGAIGLSGAGQMAQAGLADQANAQGMLTNALGQARGQDSQIQLANMDAQLRAMGMNDQARLGYLSQLTGMDQGQIMAQMAAFQAAQQNQGMIGGLISAGGQIGSALALHSDENLKDDITDAGDEVDAMLDALMPKAYVYKDSKHGEGRRVGIMAQDLERSEAGKRVVYEATDGKALDINKAISAALASSARLNQRVRELEKKAG